jgi:hypothetical protein
MTHAEMHSSLRGSALEGRAPISVVMGDEDEARRQERLIRSHIENSGITDAGTGVNQVNDIWLVHYWRGELSPWPAPEGMASLPPTESGYDGFQ